MGMKWIASSSTVLATPTNIHHPVGHADTTLPNSIRRLDASTVMRSYETLSASLTEPLPRPFWQ